MAYILNGLRSYIGIENSMYRHVSAEELGAKVLDALSDKTGIKKADCIIAGNGVGAGGNISRVMSLSSVFGVGTPAFTIDLQCGSALESIAVAAAKIDSGQADIIIAGGFESSSTAPKRAYNENHPDYEKYGDDWYKVAKFVPDEHRQQAMLEGAERTAVSEKITREQLNRWVLRSHELAKKARERGVLSDITVEILEGCNRDEGIRDRMSEKLLNRLPAVLKEGKIITAGNACLTNDGAAFLVLCSERYLRENKLKPIGKFVDIAEVGNNPGQSPKSCIAAIEKLLKKNDMLPGEIDIYECNEAFAVIDELFARKYPDEIEKYNIFGGALAYGHPYGASGGIITLHALKALEEKSGKYAVCAVAAAGGVGSAILIENVE